MTIEEFKLENKALTQWCKEKYGDHPVGELLLAVEIYEMCASPDSLAWDLLELTNEPVYCSQAFLKAAVLMLH